MSQSVSSTPSVRSIVSLSAIAVLIALIGGLMVAAYELDNRSFRVAALLMVPATVAVFAPVLTAMKFRPYDIFHPLNFVALSFFFGVLGRCFFLLTSSSPVAADLLEGYPIDDLIPGSILSAIGSICLCVGYVYAGSLEFPTGWFSSILSRMDVRRLYVLLPVFFVVALVATVLFLQQTGFQYSGLASLSSKRRVLINGVESSLGYHRLFSEDVSRVILLMLTAIMLWPIRRDVFTKLSVFAFAILAVALPFLASSRSAVLITVISICVAINLLRGIRLSTLMATFLACVVVVFGMLALRRENNQGVSATETLMSTGMEPLFGNKNFACVVKLSHIQQSVPELIDYKYGQSYLGILYAPIPRSLWPGKPSIRMGREISEKLYNRGLDLKEKGGGTPPGLLAEAIVNFSVYAFPFVILTIGFLLAMFCNSLRRLAEESPAGVALYAGIVPGFTLELLGGDSVGSLIFAASVTVITLAVCLATRLKLIV